MFFTLNEFEPISLKPSVVGVKVSFRSWNNQLRQPILIAAPRSMVTVSPQEGYIHPFSELDTIGVDKPESTCKF